MPLKQRFRALLPYIAAPFAIFAAFGIYRWVVYADERGAITVWSVNYYYQRGLAAQQANDIDRAFYEYNRALSRDPDQPMVNMVLATIYARRGDQSLALATAARAVKLAKTALFVGPQPSFREKDVRRDTLFRTLSYHSKLAAAAGDTTSAEDDLKEVVKIDGEYGNERVWALVRLERLALIRGAIDEARNFLKPLLDSSPDNTIFRFERARIATAAGNEQQALVDLSFVIDNAANAMSSMFIIGAGATAMGADIRASPFDEVLSIPEIRRARLESLIMRSKIRLSLGMREPAVADLDAAVLAAPDRNDIRALRDLLRQ